MRARNDRKTRKKTLETAGLTYGKEGDTHI
jgi:hypothetical protein